jgi:hypothetical protein
MKRQEYAASSAQPEEEIPLRTTTTRQYQNTPVDVKLVLCALWVAMLFVFAYVDIFGVFRAVVVSLIYIITIIGAAIGETWVHYFIGSLVEAILLAVIARTAWKWPPPRIAPSP